MLIKLILLLFIAHLLSDFIFQPQSMVDKKNEKALTWHHVYHVIVVGVLSYLASLDINFWKAAIVLMLLHYLTDIVKSALQLKYPLKNFFFIDQGIHLLLIIAVAYAYSYCDSIVFLIDLKLKTIAIIAGFVFITKPTNIVIGNILNVFDIQVSDSNSNDESLPNAGKLIGIVSYNFV